MTHTNKSPTGLIGDGGAKGLIVCHSPYSLIDITTKGRPETAQEREWRWRRLPYGFWTVGDTRTVFFDRRYRPLWQVGANGRSEPADPTERVPWTRQCWLYDDGTDKTDGLIGQLMTVLVCVMVQVLPLSFAVVRPWRGRADCGLVEVTIGSRLMGSGA